MPVSTSCPSPELIILPNGIDSGCEYPEVIITNYDPKERQNAEPSHLLWTKQPVAALMNVTLNLIFAKEES